MSVVLTSAGSAHLIERAAGGSLANAFDALIFGAGNDDPGISDTLEQFAQRQNLILRVQSGYPKQGDTDGRNTGRGTDTWTWQFISEAGSHFVASNAAVTNYSGGALVADAPLAVHGKQTISQRPDERLIVWVNARTGDDPTIVTATESSLEGRVMRVDSFTGRVHATRSMPGGSVVRPNEVRTKAARGAHVWTAARVDGQQGTALRPEQVDSFSLYVARHVASDGDYEQERRERIDCHGHVFATENLTDPRWDAQGGYNVAHIWKQPKGTREGTYRLRYELVLCDGDLREWTNTVEVTR